MLMRASKGKARPLVTAATDGGKGGMGEGRWQETGLWPRQEGKRHEKGPRGSRKRRASVSQAHTARHAPGWGLRGKIGGVQAGREEPSETVSRRRACVP